MSGHQICFISVNFGHHTFLDKTLISGLQRSLFDLRYRREIAREIQTVSPASKTSRIRNPDWENYENLKADILKYVLQNLTRREVLDFLGRDYPQYAWSLPTLSRRMAHVGVKYVDYETDLKVVEKAVKEETSGPTDPCIKSYESNTIWQYHEAWCTDGM